ncbi:MAG: hypothetical protein K9J13_17015 [Saprospiraceae bacterium]|nr:hypothetical protein [Saprospiraceae bacterium]
MKKSIGLLFFFLIPMFMIAQQKQTDCKVLVEDLQGVYRGECKKGLAHGQGSAQGKHIYEGEFKKGYPDGEGKYIWAGDDYYEGQFKNGKRNGYGKHYMMVDGKSSFIEGYWVNDAYVGKSKNEKKYNTISKSGIERVNYIFKGLDAGKNEIIIRIKRAGNDFIGDVEQLNISGDSGDMVDLPGRFGYENVNFPFKATLSFAAPGKMTVSGAGMNIQCKLNFEILLEGSWEVVIFI